MNAPTAAITLTSRNLANAGFHLCEAVHEALSEADRAQWDALELAGAQVACTIQWQADRCEIRLGFVTGDGPPQTVLALNFPRSCPPDAAH